MAVVAYKFMCNKLYVELNQIFISKATFCNVYMMLFSLNLIMTLKVLLGIFFQPNLICN